MNLLTILFLCSTALSGVVTLSIGIANLPQPSTTYVQGSGETAQSVAEKNQSIIINSLAFKMTMIGTGLIFLFIISFLLIKHREEQLRIKDETRLEQKRLRDYQLQVEKEKAQNKSPVQQLLPKSAELDSKNKQTPINKPIQVEVGYNNKPIQVESSPELKPPHPTAVSKPDTVLHIQRQTTYPISILKNVGITTLPVKPSVTNPRSYYPRPYYPHPYYPHPYYPHPYYPRPYNTLYPCYNKPVTKH
jgi:hypothetical protein